MPDKDEVFEAAKRLCQEGKRPESLRAEVYDEFGVAVDKSQWKNVVRQMKLSGYSTKVLPTGNIVIKSCPATPRAMPRAIVAGRGRRQRTSLTRTAKGSKAGQKPSTPTKREIVESIAGQTQLKKGEVEDVLDAFVDQIERAISKKGGGKFRMGNLFKIEVDRKNNKVKITALSLLRELAEIKKKGS